MRNPAIHLLHGPIHGGGQRRACGWCLVIAAALALAPVPASASTPSPEPVPPTQEQPTAEPAFEPVDIPAPEPAPPKPPPPPEPELIAEPTDAPSEPRGLSAEQRTKIQTQRKAGIGAMAAGGVLSGIGLGMTLTFTILGDAAQNIEEPVTEVIERNDSIARVGGVLIASGVAFAAIGGILFVKAERKAKESSTVARVQLVPALGGLVLSGRF